jgi:signal transduction histidine kinase
MWGWRVCEDVVVMLGVLVRVAVLGAAVAAALESAAIAGRAGGAGWLTLLNVTVLASGCVVVLCGSLTMTRRRAAGALLTVAGLAWLVSGWDEPGADGGVVFTVGLLVSTAYPVLLAHAALRFLTPRLATSDRVALGVGYAGTLVLSGVGPALVFDPKGSSCHQCPANLVSAGADPELFDALTRAGVVAGVGWSALLAAVLAVRLVRATRPRWVAAAGVALPAIGCLAAVLADYAHSMGRGFVSDDPVDQRLVIVQAAALAAAGVGSLWPAVQRRRVRGKVTDLVLEVAAAARPGRLAERLGSIVGDPALRVLYPVSGGRVVDATGTDASPGPGHVITPVVRRENVVALLAHAPGALDMETEPAEIASVAVLALDNERLQAEALAHLADLRASRLRIVELADAERCRLERDLHDGAQQRLVTFSLSLRLASLRAGGTDSGLDRALAEVVAALADLRRVARGLFPRELADEGLAPALDTLREAAAEPIEVRSVPKERFDAPVESIAYYAVAFLTRAGTVGASVAVARDGDRLRVTVQPCAAPRDLTSLDDRVQAVGGSVSLDGGRVVVELPCVS